MQKKNNKEDEGRRWRRRDEEDEQEEEEEEEVMRQMKKKKMQKKKKKKEMKMKKKTEEEEEEEDDDVEEEEDELRGRWEAMRSRSFHYQCTRRSCSKNTEHSETIQQLAALRSFFFTWELFHQLWKTNTATSSPRNKNCGSLPICWDQIGLFKILVKSEQSSEDPLRQTEACEKREREGEHVDHREERKSSCRDHKEQNWGSRSGVASSI